MDEEEEEENGTKKKKEEEKKSNGTSATTYPSYAWQSSTKSIFLSPIPSNSALLSFISLVKSHTLEFLRILGIIKLSIQLSIPEIEDGGNVGVEVQEEAIGELHRAEETAYTILERPEIYYSNRAKLASKIVKYVMIEDYQQCVLELDEQMYVQLKNSLKTLKNLYIVNYDLLVKNQEKLQDPRSASVHQHML